ncbi:prolyl oligopeptidase family serine peptidase [Halomonas sp. ZH2S]|uniref:Prolyl oligopeptidase family serine peptidase n=1 Tax=Vreelandella zhuhanensis TaxID=2684210 RepID=A0A7X3GZL4_9GAMM|nr:prolyl oligopeptidase family serine peptidase [Halomonas zhuhanensis]MWJ27783.1 prolyl oligopeptidase family serine peptidase [Halomonas zhuhanensis]
MKAQPCATPHSPVAPHARTDDPKWHWLEQRDAPEVTAFLEAANAQSDAWFSPLDALTQALFDGQLARRELAVTSLKTPLDYFTFWNETAADADHPSWWRHPNGAPENSQCVLDVGARAAGHEFYDMGDMALSPDEDWLAWTEDTQGDERFSLWLKQLPAGEPQRLLEDIGATLCWAEDQTATSATLLFTRFDATQRPDSVWRLPLRLAAPQVTAETPVLLLQEPDSEFWLGVGKSRSRRWLMVESASKDTSEVHLVPAQAPHATPICLQPRKAGVEYNVEHRPGAFYVLHNRNGANFQLDCLEETTLPPNPPEEGGVEVAVAGIPFIAHREDVTLEGVEAFSWGLVLAERDHRSAQVYLRRIELDDKGQTVVDEQLDLPEIPCSQDLEDTPHFDTRILRLREESFTQSPRWIALDLDTQQRTELKRLPVHGNLQPEQLVSKRLWATAADGERIPVSVVMRADLADHPLPTLLYGYGAYGEPLDPWFSIARLELLERGVAFAVAHVRGGGECGEPWYLTGKMAHKDNSFGDFLAAREVLVKEGVSKAKKVVAYGASAGGLLVATCVNRAPQAFCAAVLDVPFVDVLRTMQNPDLPLTTAEYSEWGNPEAPDVAERIRAYSPLDNLTEQAYPAMLIEGSWYDTRVGYWEPAKLYARMTQLNTSDAPILLRTDMSAGHGGASGRFKAWRDAARQDAFILWALGLADVTSNA